MVRVDYFKQTDDFVEYAAGQVIIEEGMTGDTMFAVKEGTVEIFHKDKLLDTVGEGEFFGEMALVDPLPRSAKAIAQTDCKLVRVDRDRFLFLVQETPTFALQVMQVMADRIRKMNALI